MEQQITWYIKPFKFKHMWMVQFWTNWNGAFCGFSWYVQSKQMFLNFFLLNITLHYKGFWRFLWQRPLERVWRFLKQSHLKKNRFKGYFYATKESFQMFWKIHPSAQTMLVTNCLPRSLVFQPSRIAQAQVKKFIQ